MTLIDYEGALELGDVTDTLLRAAGMPDLSLREMPWRASNRSAAGAAHEGVGDELLRQAFKYVYDFALHERNLSLVGGHTSELNFNSSNLSLAQYWAELPTSMVSLAELQEQSRVLDNTVRRMRSHTHPHPHSNPSPNPNPNPDRNSTSNPAPHLTLTLRRCSAWASQG